MALAIAFDAASDSDGTGAGIHEAAHAVVPYQYGWRVSHKGVEIGGLPSTGLHFDRLRPEVRDDPLLKGLDRYTEEARVCVSQAGWLAEVRWPGNADIPGARRRSDEDLMDTVANVK